MNEYIEGSEHKDDAQFTFGWRGHRETFIGQNAHHDFLYTVTDPQGVYIDWQALFDRREYDEVPTPEPRENSE